MRRVSKLKIPGIARIPKKLRIISSNGKRIQAVRQDGLTIFLDRDSDDTSQLLNRIRLFAPSEQVLHAVGLIRGFQVSISYAKRYRPETVSLLEQEFARFKDKLSSYASPDHRGTTPTTLLHRLNDV